MMKSLTCAVLGAALLLGACQQDNKEVLDKLTSIEKRLSNIEAKGVGGVPQQRPSRPTPDPSKTYAVKVDDMPFEGNPSAPVTIIKAYDYACPYCEKVRATMDAIQGEYGDKVRIAYGQFVVHPQIATIPAQAACAAYRQGKFKEMDNLLWEKGFKARQFDESAIAGFAKEIGLDMDKYNADLKGPCVNWVQQQVAMLSSFGVAATPGFFINGRFLSGAQPLPAFKALIDEELKKAQDRIAQGTPADSYYKTWVVEKGAPKLQ
ncbi:MAG TPA: thioredoxin domain-containing protein [Kofleriaceae bacterium]|nr:thioredoxin domain-containing protein [Kofleriaceae bacterium]